MDQSMTFRKRVYKLATTFGGIVHWKNKRDNYRSFYQTITLPGDPKSWESPDEAEIVWRLFIQILLR